MGRTGRDAFRHMTAVMAAGLLIGLGGNLSTTPEKPLISIPFVDLVLVHAAEASGTSPANLSESAPIPLLNAWPDITDEAPKVKEAAPAPVRKRTMERPLLNMMRKTSAIPVIQGLADVPPEVDSTAKVVLASLFTPAESGTVSASDPAVPVTTAPAGEPEVNAQNLDEETPVEGDVSGGEMGEASGEEATFDEETPVYTEEELQQTQVNQPAPAPAAEPAPSSASAPDSGKKIGHKGYMIRVEGDDLVVYDAQGTEIYRKGKSESRSKTHLSKIKDAASKLEEEVAQPDTTNGAPSVGTLPPNGGDLVFHEVKKGENPSTIARQYAGLTAQKLMEANGISNPSSIQIGTKLWIPNAVQGVTHVVQEGETLSDLLKKYEVNNLFEVCDVNGLSRDTNEVAAGTVLVIPGAKVRPQAPVKKRPTAIMIDPAAFKGRAGWTWPVEGAVQLSSPYGLRIDPFARRSAIAAGGGKDGVKRSFHHGIDMSMPVGTPVKAARDGEVIKVSQSRWGHGRMVQVLHEDGWSTVYSHNSKILVKVGDRVKQGDLLALSGNTGRSTGPHLHFEVRRPDQKSIDPRRFLSALE